MSFFLIPLPPTRSTLFPYTTLFRSRVESANRYCQNRSQEVFMSFRPLHDRVLIRRVEAEEKSAGGIIIPDTAKEKPMEDRKSTRLNSSHVEISYAVFCLKKKK